MGGELGYLMTALSFERGIWQVHGISITLLRDEGNWWDGGIVILMKAIIILRLTRDLIIYIPIRRFLWL